MTALTAEGHYQLANRDSSLFDLFEAGFASEDETTAEIKRVYEEDHYIEDPHTAVASSVYMSYRQRTGDETPTIIASTASPYKFPRVAVEAVTGETPADDFEAVTELHRLSGVLIPEAVRHLQQAPVRHNTLVSVKDMQKAVESYLGVS